MNTETIRETVLNITFAETNFISCYYQQWRVLNKPRNFTESYKQNCKDTVGFLFPSDATAPKSNVSSDGSSV